MTEKFAGQNPEDAFRITIDRFAAAYRTITFGLIDSEPKKIGRFWCVDVVPTIRRVVKTGDNKTTTKPLPKLTGVPLALPGCASLGLSISIPLNIGDECILLVSDRGIDNWQLASGPQDPPELEEIRHHELTDALCLPLGSATENIESYDNEAIKIQNKDGSTSFSVKAGEIKAEVGSGSAVLTDGKFSIIANVDIKGNFATSDGSFTHNGTDVGEGHSHKKGSLKDAESRPLQSGTTAPAKG